MPVTVSPRVMLVTVDPEASAVRPDFKGEGDCKPVAVASVCFDMEGKRGCMVTGVVPGALTVCLDLEGEGMIDSGSSSDSFPVDLLQNIRQEKSDAILTHTSEASRVLSNACTRFLRTWPC